MFAEIQFQTTEQEECWNLFRRPFCCSFSALPAQVSQGKFIGTLRVQRNDTLSSHIYSEPYHELMNGPLHALGILKNYSCPRMDH